MDKQNTVSIAEKVKILIKNHLECNTSLLNSSQDKKIVAFFGFNGSGKSTLINFLCGRELEVNKKSIVLKNPSASNSCKIGDTLSSTTLLPQCIEYDNILFYDFAGFEDNRGVEYSLLNACFIKWIIENASNVLFVFVVEDSTFNLKRAEPFLDLINKIKILIPGIESTHNNLLVMTKVYEWEEEEFEEYMQDEKKNIFKIVKDNIDLKILKMSKPSSRKEINYDDRTSILKAIQSEQGIKIPSVNIEAIYSLKESAIVEQLYEIEAQDIYEKLFPTINISDLDQQNLNAEKIRLESVLSQFQKQMESNKLIMLLKTISQQIFNSCFDKYQKLINLEKQVLFAVIEKEESKRREKELNELIQQLKDDQTVAKAKQEQELYGNKTIEFEFTNPKTDEIESKRYDMTKSSERQEFLDTLVQTIQLQQPVYKIKKFDEIQLFLSSQDQFIDNTQYNCAFGQQYKKALQQNFTLLAKCQGSDFEYNSEYWTTNNTLNQHDRDIMKQQCAKYKQFNTLKIKYLYLIDQSGRYTILELKNCQNFSLLQIFQNNLQINCSVLEGCRTPLELIIGYQHLEKSYLPHWRINSYSSDFKFKNRIGGYYQHIWQNYGCDTLGNMTAAEMAGFGITDNHWQPTTYAKKSYGIRAAHDKTDTPDGKQQGQYQGYSLILGKS